MTDERDLPPEQSPQEPPDPEAPRDEDDLPDLDDVEMRDLLRGALRPPPGSVAPRLLPGVQQKLRARSRGKFYGDGWSTTQAPRSTYLVTSIVMLILVAIVFLVLIPWSGSALQ
jgi:hypothetical protein